MFNSASHAGMNENAVQLLWQKNWAVLKADYIKTSTTHRCIRKFYILSNNMGKELEFEFLSVRPSGTKKKHHFLFV